MARRWFVYLAMLLTTLALHLLGKLQPDRASLGQVMNLSRRLYHLSLAVRLAPAGKHLVELKIELLDSMQLLVRHGFKDTLFVPGNKANRNKAGRNKACLNKPIGTKPAGITNRIRPIE